MDPSLVRKRAPVRALVTKLIRNAKSALAKGESGDAEGIYLTLEDKLKQLAILDKEIFDNWDADEDVSGALMDSEVEQVMNYEVSGRTCVSDLKTLLHRNTSRPTSAMMSFHTVKLPKLELPKFGGSRIHWQSFWQIFEASIHKNCGLADVQKFTYLVGCLTNEAKAAVNGLAMTAENYVEAIDILQKRFGDPAVATREHLNRLHNLKSASDAVSQIQRFFDEISVHVRNLENIGVPSSSYEVMLLPILLSKLPENLQWSMLHRSSGEGQTISTMTYFLELLAAEIKVRETICEDYSSSTSEKKAPVRNNQMTHIPVPAVTSLGTDSQSKSAVFADVSGRAKVVKSKAKTCPYCSQDHLAAECTSADDLKERVAILKRDGRCFRCLAKGHMSRQCRSVQKCSHCGRRHHVSICNNKEVVTTNPEHSSFATTNLTSALSSQSPDNRSQMLREQNEVALLVHNSTTVVMPTARAILKAPGSSKEIEVRVLLDSASNRTFVREDVVNLLGIEQHEYGKLSINTFAKTSGEERLCGVANFELRKPDSSQVIPMKGYTIPSICASQLTVSLDSYPHLQDLDLADHSFFKDPIPEISVLIGADQFYDIVFGETRRGEFGPTAVASKLGWLLCGPLSLGPKDDTVDIQDRPSCLTPVLHCASVEKELAQFWDLEHIGISTNEETKPFVPYPVNLVDGRYQTTLPWKSETEELPSNFNIAQKRLRSVVTKLNKQPEVMEEYQRIFQEQLQDGIIEQIPDAYSPAPVHYLPHLPVVRPSAESTKVRIVFDASSKESGQPSLNEHLQTGSVDLPHIASLLSQFRYSPIAILADIEKAFLQVSIAPEDRDALRFLWLDDPKSSDPKVMTYRFTRLLFGLTASPAILSAVLAFHVSSLRDEDAKLFAKLNGQIYVDNLVTGCDSVDEAKELYSKTKEVFLRAQFNMRQWSSNSPEFLQSVDFKDISGSCGKEAEEESISHLQLNPSLQPVNKKVLGIEWDSTNDEYIFDLRHLATVSTNDSTKRSVLATIASVYDPLGFLTPILIQMKILFQKLCKTHKWEDRLETSDSQMWNNWIKRIATFVVRIPRHIPLESHASDVISLHGFCDASQSAYAAAVYVRIFNEERDEISCFLIVSKTRVSPLAKKHTISRLELLGALLLARLITFIIPSFSERAQINGINLWTDSMNALHWIREKEKIREVFVQNRVREIRSLTESMTWAHVAGKDNPADLPSRGVRPDKLQSSSMWWNGPSWLSSPEHQWPTQNALDEQEQDEEVDMHQEAVLQTVATDNSTSISNLFQLERFSSVEKIFRVTSYVMRFVNRLKGIPPSAPYLTLEEIKSSEKMWIRELQQKYFLPELCHLQNNGPITPKIKNLNLFVDEEGLLRCRGRVTEDVHPISIDPILLPNDKTMENLYIMKAHEAVFHGGVSATLAKIREEIWLLKGRQKVKGCLRRCVVCKKVQGLPYVCPPLPRLPSYRLTSDRAFSTTGVDYCGPLIVSIRKGEENMKMYILLFTCASTRAIHIEVVQDLSTKSFLLALKRFVSRRGIPDLVSDNASTFKAAEKTISKAQVQDFASTRKIRWEFVTQYAPWMGGFYERMIKDVKMALRKTLGKRSINFEQLRTLCCEIEGVLNSRPLAYIGEDVEEAVTPSHFLILQRLTRDGDYRKSTNRLRIPNMKDITALLNVFWDRWTKDYVASLRERSFSGVHKARGTTDSPKVNDLCLVVDKSPRLQWKMARIIRLCPGRDGHVRSVVVRIVGGRGESKRPVSMLVPLERNC